MHLAVLLYSHQHALSNYRVLPPTRAHQLLFDRVLEKTSRLSGRNVAFRVPSRMCKAATDADGYLIAHYEVLDSPSQSPRGSMDDL
jgi:hypothetical protein